MSNCASNADGKGCGPGPRHSRRWYSPLRQNSKTMPLASLMASLRHVIASRANATRVALPRVIMTRTATQINRPIDRPTDWQLGPLIIRDSCPCVPAIQRQLRSLRARRYFELHVVVIAGARWHRQPAATAEFASTSLSFLQNEKDCTNSE